MLCTRMAINVAAVPTTITIRLTTDVNLADEASGLMRGRYTFQAAMDDADRTDESTEDITAAETAPSPMADTTGGVRCRRT